jgi:transcriptional regulator GlxA family with amidase domain
MREQTEYHFTVEEIARNRNLSADTIRKLFVDEPGVIVISKPKRFKRVYRTLRIPESVERRVFARITNPGPR